MGTVYAVGIDFGTANSCVAYATYFDRGEGEVDPDPLHRPEVIPFHNRDTVPTALHLGDGKVQPPTFGVAAEERGAIDPQRFYTGFKLQLGRPETGHDAYLMAKYFLGYLKRRIQNFVPLDNPSPGERVETVVGHPVQWSADQREATLRAAQEAGFPNVRLEEESLAALYCHIFDERAGFTPKPGSHVLTIDMGGGTTDFAFLQIPSEPGQRPVSIPVHPAPEGPRSYGGRDLDVLLFKYFSRAWDEETVRQQGRALLRQMRIFKEAFSNNIMEGATEYESVVVVGDRPQRMKLTRDGFERIAGHYIAHFQTLVRGALQEAGLRPDQVTQLILTGGHSKWYFVEHALGEIFPHLYVGQRTIFRHSHPEQSVARGLAYDPLVRSGKGTFLAPARRAAHPIWLQIRGGSKIETNGGGAVAKRQSVDSEPVLLVPKGQLLPFQTQTPLKFDVEQAGSNENETRVKVQFLSGNDRVLLAARMATFQRSFWEQVSNSIAAKLFGGATKERFQVEIHFTVDEHEMIDAELRVARLLRGKRSEVQRQQLHANVHAREEEQVQTLAAPGAAAAPAAASAAPAPNLPYYGGADA
jgi:hypothetical protein